MRLVVCNFKQFREAVVEGERVLLYGPNGGGKSVLIHLIALFYGAAVGVRIHDERVVSAGDFEKDTYVRFESGEFAAEIVGDRLVYGGREYPLGSELRVASASVWHVDERGFRVFWAGGGCRGVPISGEPLGDRLGYGELRVLCPEAARAVSSYFNVYYDVVEVGGRWLPVDRLSFGQRRLLVLTAAFRLGDVVLVENLEAGLHVGMLADLVTTLPHLKSKVVLETHSGLAVKLALSRGLAAYYVDEGQVKRIQSLDLQLFQRELSVYSSLL